MMVMGDIFQWIFLFNGSSDTYFSDPTKYFGNHLRSNEFFQKRLTISWRITHEMAHWINENLNPNKLKIHYTEWWSKNGERYSKVWGSGIRANPSRPFCPGSVEFRNFANFTDPALIEKIEDSYNTFGTSETTTLAITLKSSNCPLRVIVDHLGKWDDWYIDVQESEKSTSIKYTQGKRYACTPYKFKGKECDCVIVLGMDSYWEDKKTPIELFNLMYVMCTRARNKLIIIRFDSNSEYATMRLQKISTAASEVRKRYSVTDLLEYTKFDDILGVTEQFCTTTLFKELSNGFDLSLHTDIPGRNEGTHESLTNTIGIAMDTKLSLILLENKSLEFNPFHWEIKECLDDILRIPRENIDSKHLIMHAICVECNQTKYIHKLRQTRKAIEIHDFSFFSTSVTNCIHLMYDLLQSYDSALTSDSKSEDISKALRESFIPQQSVFYETHGYTIDGCIDLISIKHKIIIEVKMSTAIEDKYHILQALLYKSMNPEYHNFDTFLLYPAAAKLIKVDLKLDPDELVKRVLAHKTNLNYDNFLQPNDSFPRNFQIMLRDTIKTAFKPYIDTLMNEVQTELETFKCAHCGKKGRKENNFTRRNISTRKDYLILLDFINTRHFKDFFKQIDACIGENIDSNSLITKQIMFTNRAVNELVPVLLDYYKSRCKIGYVCHPSHKKQKLLVWKEKCYYQF
jgi:hypothetical protein